MSDNGRALNCGSCGYRAHGDTDGERSADMLEHLREHPAQTLGELREMLRNAIVPGGTVVSAVAVPPALLHDLPEYTCGMCGETFGTNFLPDEIECAYCEARRCPHCELWFGGES
jgi:hypothetical protein